MKKLFFSIFCLLTLTLVSCKKDYTCKCTTLWSDGEVWTDSYTINAKEKDAKTECDSYETTGSEYVETCEIM